RICGVPVGTVRSRLSQAKAKLAEALVASADVTHADAAALTESRRQQAFGIMQAAQQGSFANALAESWSKHAEIIGPQGQHGRGLALLIHIMNSDLEAGVRQRVTNVVAGPGVIIWEAELISPPDDPQHCPPAVVWLQTLRSGRVERLRLFHPLV
ncbi:MAG TPA: sigma-70 family RNA polymerase sigma factor, partial [Micromonosporaceae bacterium]|nr:sigma-70 family RNA polymerase sigma factor [Micromonosporaceae bacterium]